MKRRFGNLSFYALVIAVLVFSAGIATATTIYVSPGDDLQAALSSTGHSTIAPVPSTPSTGRSKSTRTGVGPCGAPRWSGCSVPRARTGSRSIATCLKGPTALRYIGKGTTFAWNNWTPCSASITRYSSLHRPSRHSIPMLVQAQAA